MVLREVVNSACKAANGPSFGQPMERQPHRGAASEVQKVPRDVHGTSSAAAYAVNYSPVNTLRRVASCHHVTNSNHFLLQTQPFSLAGRNSLAAFRQGVT